MKGEVRGLEGLKVLGWEVGFGVGVGMVGGWRWGWGKGEERG